MKTYTINVTERDIKLGCKWSADNCAIARACKRVFKQDFRSCSQLCIRTENLQFKTPKRVERFIDKFDQGKKVKPFKFKLKLNETQT